MATPAVSGPVIKISKWHGSRLRIGVKLINGFDLTKAADPFSISAKGLLAHAGLSKRDREILSVVPNPAEVIHLKLTKKAQKALNMNGAWQPLNLLLPRINLHQMSMMEKAGFDVDSGTHPEGLERSEHYMIAREKDHRTSIKWSNLTSGVNWTFAGVTTVALMAEYEPLLWIAAGLGCTSLAVAEAFQKVVSNPNKEATTTLNFLRALHEMPELDFKV